MYPYTIHAIGKFARELGVFRTELGLVILSVHVLQFAQNFGAVIVIIVLVTVGKHSAAVHGAIALARLSPPR